MSYSKVTPTVQFSKKRPLVIAIPISTDEIVFCDLQGFFRYACGLNIDINRNVYLNNSSLLYFGCFLDENIFSINLKVHFPRWRVGHHEILPVMNRSILMCYLKLT